MELGCRWLAVGGGPWIERPPKALGSANTFAYPKSTLSFIITWRLYIIRILSPFVQISIVFFDKFSTRCSPYRTLYLQSSPNYLRLLAVSNRGGFFYLYLKKKKSMLRVLKKTFYSYNKKILFRNTNEQKKKKKFA